MRLYARNLVCAVLNKRNPTTKGPHLVVIEGTVTYKFIITNDGRMILDAQLAWLFSKLAGLI